MENSIRLKCQNESLILDLIGTNIDDHEFDLHLREIKRLKKFDKLYVNIANLYEIDNDTLNKFYKMYFYLKDKQICFINVNAMNNCILNLFNIDKIFQLYLNKQDAFEAKRPIINRKFKLVS